MNSDCGLFVDFASPQFDSSVCDPPVADPWSRTRPQGKDSVYRAYHYGVSDTSCLQLSPKTARHELVLGRHLCGWANHYRSPSQKLRPERTKSVGSPLPALLAAICNIPAALAHPHGVRRLVDMAQTTSPAAPFQRRKGIVDLGCPRRAFDGRKNES